MERTTEREKYDIINTHMMNAKSPTVIKTSPIVFIKRLIVFELLLTVLFFVFRYVTIVNIMVNDLDTAGIFSSTLISILLLTVLQVLVISALLFVWYSEKYIITSKIIKYRWSDLFQEKELVSLSDIHSFTLSQSKIASNMNYGYIKIKTKQGKKITLKNIPNPSKYVRLLKELLENGIDLGERIELGSVKKLLTSGEGQKVEYKSSFQWDYRKKEKNKDLHKAVMKNIAAYMNSTGGVVLIGVDDDGIVLGLKEDYALLQKQNADAFENVFNMAFKKMIGDEFRQYADVVFKKISRKEIAAIVVQPSERPVYLQYQGKEEFYIRTGNSSQPLTLRKATAYIQSRFTSL